MRLVACLALGLAAVEAFAIPQWFNLPLLLNDEIVPLQDYKVDKLSLLELHKGLVEIESISNHETEVALYLKKFLESAGLTVQLQKIVDDSPLRYNVYAYSGKKKDSKVLLTSHIDTVPPYIPYRVEGSRIYGRGSSDAKASVASQVFAYLSLLKSGEIKEGDASLLYVVGEEINGVGMKVASSSLDAHWETAIFGEPTELKLGIGHKGSYIVNLKANGKASHSGYPELGISASEILIPVLNDLLKLELPQSELLGPSTLNIGQFSGGIAANVIPAEATAGVFVRVAAELEKVDELVRGIVENVDNLDFEVAGSVEPQYLDYEVPGFDSIILAYATDIPWLKRTFKKRYLYGPGTIHVAHSDHEYVEHSDLLDAVDGYKKLTKYILSTLE